MDTKELNEKLLKQMRDEQDYYREWLVSLSPEDILHHAYEYAVREDILASLEWMDLEDNLAQTLLDCDKPLQDIYDRWENLETSYMEMIWDTIQQQAKDAEKMKENDEMTM
ncbi:MAG TPA: DUF3848 domain-containing protein [Candidatus Fimiplasma intestinipullorum]|uniref:DUF3848 domain-containing protein n=1 Tax=Candidatus Fimiplasma intestinipullorum TaxID=2840825 RepID=A0A9D1HQJ3_9FIRM|nr:DUF3848 domain-containing protein [Candidatus Fimiplasma intestinipullorum]